VEVCVPEPRIHALVHAQRLGAGRGLPRAQRGGPARAGLAGGEVQDADAVAEGFGAIDISVRRFFPSAAIQGIAVQEMVAGGKEVILGMTRDPSFGPLLMFGLGGIYVEVLKDVAFRVAPIGPDEAEAMIREIRSFPLLRGVRGEKPSDLNAIVDALCRLSQLCVDFPEVLEMDVNPLLVKPEGEGAVAIDARLGLAP